MVLPPLAEDIPPPSVVAEAIPPPSVEAPVVLFIYIYLYVL
jgi:hypothetical protein